MHVRHRSPGNGYRSSSMGISGVAAPSRISPESSIRGHGLYNPEYRSYSRGFGRGQPKAFQAPPPPPRRGDLFVEAGRLATEYLISKGLLPPNVLSGKWQNGSLKMQTGDLQGFRRLEGENFHLPPEGRTSALARLGNPVPEAGFGRRRFPDEYNAAVPRRGRRRTGFVKNNGSELNRDLGRSGYLSDKAKDSSDMDADDGPFPSYQEDQEVGKDDTPEFQKSSPTELVLKGDNAGGSESTPQKYQIQDIANLKAISSSDKDLVSDFEVGPNDMGISCIRSTEMKDGSGDDEMEKQMATENISVQHHAVNDVAGKSGNDLLTFCRFVKVPTKIRSSLTIKGSKHDLARTVDGENNHENRLPGGLRNPVEDVAAFVSLTDAYSNQNLIHVDSSAHPEEDGGETDLANTAGQGKCKRSASLKNEQESSERPPGFGRSNSMIIDKGDKRTLELADDSEGSKKLRGWIPPTMDIPADDNLQLSNPVEKLQTSQEEKTSQGEVSILPADEKRLADNSLLPKAGTEPCIEYAEEKQLFPGSFKICDLNLMEGSDVNENHEANPILMFPSILEGKKDAAPLDIDLSMNSNGNASCSYGRWGTDGKEVEVIDLENDSMQEEKVFNSSERKAETLFTGLETFPNQTQNVHDSHDGQDGYGLMISELMGNDIPSCSSVPPDINSLHNDMGLQNGEGILGDDDSIYMSLGEIPISFLRVWEQPTQEFEKPF